MADGIYVAASGMMAKLTELDIVANNMANANTPGFKRDVVTFDEVLADESLRSEQQDLHYVEIGKSQPNSGCDVHFSSASSRYGQVASILFISHYKS